MVEQIQEKIQKLEVEISKTSEEFMLKILEGQLRSWKSELEFWENW